MVELLWLEYDIGFDDGDGVGKIDLFGIKQSLISHKFLYCSYIILMMFIIVKGRGREGGGEERLIIDENIFYHAIFYNDKNKIHPRL